MKNLVIYAVIIIAGYLFYTFTQADRDDSGVIVSEGNIDAFSIQVGDCYNDDDGSELKDEETIEVVGVAGVPCTELHDNEVFALVDLALTDYPGDEEISNMAFDSCLIYFEPFVGKDYETSSLDIYTLYPTVESWADDDREVVCAVFDVDLKQLQGSMKGLGI